MTAEFYTGSYGHAGEESIIRFRADFDHGTLTRTMVSTAAECPSYLLKHPNGKILYAVRELTDEGALYTFAIEGDGLRLLSTLPTGGQDPCHLSLDESARFLFAANYTGGSFCVFRLDERGVPQERTALVRHSGSGANKVRQASAHPHCAVHAGASVFVCDLGMDRVFRCQLDRATGGVTETGSFSLPPASGPRHLLPSPVNAEILYVVGELVGKVFVFRLRGASAELIQEISALPDSFSGQNISAALKLSHDRKALFVSNRGDDSIAVFRILPDGRLTRTDICKTGGKTPRDFSVFGEYLIAANQDSDLLTVLRYDSSQCTLTPTGISAPVLCPTCILPD